MPLIATLRRKGLYLFRAALQALEIKRQLLVCLTHFTLKQLMQLKDKPIANITT